MSIMPNVTRAILSAAFMVALAPPASAQDIVIKAAKIYTQAGPPLSPGVVRINDGKIVEVGSNISPPSGARVIDLGQGVLIPGMIDAYTSLGLEGGASESTREVTPELAVLDGIDWHSRSFRFASADGTTIALVAPSSDNVFAGQASIVKTFGPVKGRVVAKNHALVITASSDPAAGNSARNRPDSIYNRQPTNRMGVNWILRNEFSHAKKGESNAIRDAVDGRRPVLCVSRLDCDIQSALRLRNDYPMNLTVVGGHEAYKVRAQLAQAKIPVLLSRLATTGGSGPEQSEVVLNNAGMLHDAGVVFALTGGQLLDQARFAVRFGLAKEAALAAVTNVPAKLLGIDRRIGSIETGKDADLVALSGDPLEFSTAIRWTMIDGVLRSEE